jgi:hypothetical protein
MLQKLHGTVLENAFKKVGRMAYYMLVVEVKV